CGSSAASASMTIGAKNWLNPACCRPSRFSSRKLLVGATASSVNLTSSRTSDGSEYPPPPGVVEPNRPATYKAQPRQASPGNGVQNAQSMLSDSVYSRDCAPVQVCSTVSRPASAC